MDWNFGWDTITTIAIGLMVVAGIWQRAKSIIKETAQALTAVSDAIDDDEVTLEESQDIVNEFIDVIMAARGKL